jgi:gluconokinase
MPASLVDSQFATLEAPAADENALTLDATRPIADIIADAMSLFEANS